MLSAPTSASSTSTTAIGCTRACNQVGTAATGRRSLICRMISKDVDPLPSTTAARKVTTSAGVAVRIRSTCQRDCRCGESCSGGPGGTMPER